MSTPNIVIVFIGESGSGKSTAVNYFANYFTKSSFDQQNHYSNVKIVIPNNLFPVPNYPPDNHAHTERNVHDNTMSQTQDCSVYDLTWNERSIKVIDTPGFNDTNASVDDQNIQKILRHFALVPFITAIVITINGTNTRLSTSIKTMLSQLRGSLPDSVFKNLFFIFTNCTEETRNFDLKLIDEFNPAKERIFHLQNSLFSIKDKSVLKDDKLVRRMVRTWDESVETIGEIMDEISRTSNTSVEAFEKMRIERDGLVTSKENLIEKLKSLLNTMEALKIEENRLDSAENEQKLNENFKEQKTINVIELETKSFYSTLCIQHRNVQVCHSNCSLTYQPTFNFAHFKYCAAADGNNCRHCQCRMNDHLHSFEIPVSKSKTIEEIVQSKQAAYDIASKNVTSINVQLDQLRRVRDQHQTEVDDIKTRLLTTIRKLKEICTHFNFPEEMKGTIQKLRQEAKCALKIHFKEEFDNTANAIEALLEQLQ